MEKYLEFPGAINEKWNEFLKYEKLNDLLSAFSGPINIVNTDVMAENIEKFKEVFKKYKIQNKIFLAEKSTKSEAFVRRALLENINLDVASVGELEVGLKKGFTGNMMEATGPKNEEFLELAIRHGVLINVDNEEELDQIIKIKNKFNISKVNILLRLNDFKSKTQNIINKNSKFGIPLKDIEKTLKMLESKELKNNIKLKGFSFHLDTVSIQEKIIAIENILEVFSIAYEYELDPEVIDLGGGYKSKLISDNEKWSKSISNIKKSLLGEIPNIRYNNENYGVLVENNTLKGNVRISDFNPEKDGADSLEEILTARLESFEGRKIYEILNDNMITLYIEPGAALLKGAGHTFSKVNYVKTLADNNILIGLDMKKSDVSMGSEDKFIDPLHFYDESNENERDNSKDGVYMSGNLCMETDFIYRHKIYLDKKIKAGDIILIPNTSGYYMDFRRTDTARQNIAKIIVWENGKIYLDEKYR